MKNIIMLIRNIIKSFIDRVLHGRAVKYFCLLFNKYSLKKTKLCNRLRTIYYTHTFSECGSGLRVFGRPIIYHPEKIKVGKNVTINNGAQISPRGNVIIGDYVTMSRGSQITSGSYNTKIWNEKNGCNYKLHKHIENDVFVGDGTWLCVNSIVLPGVKIKGKGVIVAAGAVVTSDINDDFVLVAGVPAKIIKYI